MKLYRGSRNLIRRLQKLGGYDELVLLQQLGCLEVPHYMSNSSGIGIYNASGILVAWLNPTGTVDVRLENNDWNNELSGLQEVIDLHKRGTL